MSSAVSLSIENSLNGGYDNQDSRDTVPVKQRPKPVFWPQMKTKNIFVGSTKDMNGHVFQTMAEQKKKNQFNETLEELKTFALQKYIKHIDHLTPLFTTLTQPALQKQVLKSSRKIIVTLESGKKQEIDQSDPFEQE